MKPIFAGAAAVRRRSAVRLMIISLEREGEFPVGWTHSHDHQCGNKGQPILHYRVYIEGREEDLNSQGWLLDNNAIVTYFATTYATVKDFQSCESIARRAVRELRRLVVAGGAHARRVLVGVTGIPGSWISADWVGSTRVPLDNA